MSVLSEALGQVATGIVIDIAIAALLDHVINGGWAGRRAYIVLPGVVALKWW